ncbi:MAG: hypothetical protein M1587_05520, partial [Thaumarchaeota archaeon]|nr:hypothetical protein [Nitrososphaerota archaeon]
MASSGSSSEVAANDSNLDDLRDEHHRQLMRLGDWAASTSKERTKTMKSSDVAFYSLLALVVALLLCGLFLSE